MNKSKNLLEKLLADHSFTKDKTGKKFLCQFHPDTNPSGSIYEKDGKWWYKCFSCGWQGDWYNVSDDMNKLPKGTTYKKMHDIPESTDMCTKTDKSPQTHRQPHICSKKEEKKQRIYSLKEIENGGTAYKYTSPETNIVSFIVVRYELQGKSKSFGQFSPTDGGGFKSGGLQVYPIYNRSRIRQSSQVVVVEGEKCVHALHDIGIVATTKPCGAQAPEKADWSPLYGKEVVLWPDSDTKGIGYMRQVQTLLTPHCKVKWLDPPEELPEKGDAWDYCQNHTKAEVEAFIGSAKSKLSSDLFGYLGDIASGRIKNIDMGWPVVASMTQAFVPETVTFLCGQGGDGKSLLTTQAMQYIHKNGVKWCMYELEKSHNFHLARSLAQRTEDSTIVNFKDLLGQEDYVDALEECHADWVDDFGKHIWLSPDKMASLDDVDQWIESRAKEGYRVIMVDPITAAGKGDLPVWTADEKFINAVIKIVKNHKCSVLLITHPATSMSTTPSLDGLKGGKMMGNLCDTVLWLTTVEPKEVPCVLFSGITLPRTINREMTLVKTRSGKGQNARIGFFFDSTSLTFEEFGVIKKEKK